MWDLIVLVPDHCLSFCFVIYVFESTPTKKDALSCISAKLCNFKY